MKHVIGDELNKKLKKQKRVYLCGKFEHPDILSAIETNGLEIGISQYPNYTAELPHIHTWNYEYNYVIEGSVKVYVFSEKMEYCFQSGDMYLIEPDMAYITKAAENTRVLFIKDPGGNDKKLVHISQPIRKWMENWNERMIDK